MLDFTHDPEDPVQAQRRATVEMIGRAKSRLERGWCQRSDARDAKGIKVIPTDKSAVSWCMRGAFMVEAGRCETLKFQSLFMDIFHRPMENMNDEAQTVDQVLSYCDTMAAEVLGGRYDKGVPEPVPPQATYAPVVYNTVTWAETATWDTIGTVKTKPSKKPSWSPLPMPSFWTPKPEDPPKPHPEYLVGAGLAKKSGNRVCIPKSMIKAAQDLGLIKTPELV